MIIKLILLLNSILFGFLIHTQTFRHRLKFIGDDAGAIGSFFMLIIGIAGVILLFLGIFGLKKYADNSQQNPLGKPMIFLVAGALMTAFTAFQILLSSSFVGRGIDGNTGRDEFRVSDL